MVAGLIETEDDLYRFLKKIRRACDKAGPLGAFEEFTIIRRLPGGRPPYIQFIHGVMPEGYNPFSDGRESSTTNNKAAAGRRRTKRKRRAGA